MSMTRAWQRKSLLLAFAAACAPAKQLHAQAGSTYRPVADHHAHLQSKAAWQLLHEIFNYYSCKAAPTKRHGNSVRLLLWGLMCKTDESVTSSEQDLRI